MIELIIDDGNSLKSRYFIPANIKKNVIHEVDTLNRFEIAVFCNNGRSFFKLSR